MEGLSRHISIELNGSDFALLDPLLILQTVDEQSVKSRATTQTILGRDGASVSQLRRDQLDIKIEFAIRSKDPETRIDVMHKVNAWAQGGGILTTSYRPGYWLYVLPSVMPSISDVRKWTGNLSFTLTAYSWPYWQSSNHVSFDFPASQASGDGSWQIWDTMGQLPVEFAITPSGVMSSFTVTVNGKSISLTGLNTSRSITLEYTVDQHLQRIIGSTGSLLRHRAAESADELLAGPGANTVSYSASCPCTVQLRVRRMQT